MTDWNVNRWERLEEIAQSVAPDETLSLLVGERIIEARITGTRPAKQIEQDDWILVSERLPERGRQVLAWYDGLRDVPVQSWIYPATGKWHLSRTPTHWRPLPAPPTQKADGYQVNMLTPE